MQTEPGKIIVALSGGVDSSVAALLLLEQGHDVEALFMKNWDERDEGGVCLWEADVEDALKVCDSLGITLNAIDLSVSYRRQVFDEFLAGYRRGRTPNPDVLCNQEIKFRAFLDYARGLDAARIATGHYAQINQYQGQQGLYKGVDPNKDQSYFLCRLNQQQLRRSLFPVGGLNKSQVRALARRHGLVTHDKKDSVGICFIGARRFRSFLTRHLPVRPGPILTLQGEEIGRHEGAQLYTLGQRQGLGIGGIRGSAAGPWYVADKNVQENTITVVQGRNHPRLFSRGLIASDMHWIARVPDLPLQCGIKTRYRQVDQRCIIEAVDSGQVTVSFVSPQRAVTPGQYAVFYDGDLCLGSAVIEQTL